MYVESELAAIGTPALRERRSTSLRGVSSIFSQSQRAKGVGGSYAGIRSSVRSKCSGIVGYWRARQEAPATAQPPNDGHLHLTWLPQRQQPPARHLWSMPS